MKLLHVIASANPAGGGPIEGIIRQNNAMAAHGSRDLVTADRPDAPFLADFPMRVHALGLRPKVLHYVPISRYGYTPHLVPWLRKHARDYDAVVVNGLWNYAAAAAARALPDAGVPYFVYPHGMMDPWFQKTYPFKHLAKQASWLAFEGRLLAHADAVLFTTQEEMELAADQFWGHRYRGVVANYGTEAPPVSSDAQLAALHTAVPELGDRPFLLFLSRIHPKKGCDLLIKAFAACAAEHPDLQLVMAGPDSEGLTDRLKRQAEAAGIAKSVHWPGMLVGDAKWGAFYGTLAFVLPSHQENFGIVVAEALACSTPVLITDKVNIWREVEAGGGGIVTEDTAKSVEEGLRQLLSLSPSTLAAMRISARKTFDQNFNLSQVVPRLREILATTRR